MSKNDFIENRGIRMSSSILDPYRDQDNTLVTLVEQFKNKEKMKYEINKKDNKEE